MQVIQLSGDGKDDLLLDGRIVYPCAAAMPGGPALAIDVTGDAKPDLLRRSGPRRTVRGTR